MREDGESGEGGVGEIWRRGGGELSRAWTLTKAAEKLSRE